MFKGLRKDIAAIRERDPAARSALEVLLLYSGLHALMIYRVAHWCYLHRLFFMARLLSQLGKWLTGVEIHPGATIGRGILIDHGSGIVIGETAVVGDNCTLYQGVTLGGTGKDTGKRHPTLEDGVLVGAGAKLLGPFTVGAGAKVAANAVVLGPIPAGCTAVGIPARVVRRDGKKIDNLDHLHMPDPVAQELCRMGVQIQRLEKQLRLLEEELEETKAKSRVSA